MPPRKAGKQERTSSPEAGSATLGQLRSFARVLVEPEARAAIETSAQELWRDWDAYRRRFATLTPPIAARADALDAVLQRLLAKHERDSLEKIVTRSDWPDVQAAASALLTALRDASDPTEARSVAELVAAIDAGATPDYLFFWGHTGTTERACFSQWYPASFAIGGTRYATAEHWMMAEKARLFGDAPARERVLAAATPAEAKKIGREVQGFDEKRWARDRLELVAIGNRAKFAQNDELGRILRATSAQVLVEASPRDRIWGIGMGASNDRARSPRAWRGLNLLGFALMEARARLAR